jgi:circadian clock protein KaiB
MKYLLTLYVYGENSASKRAINNLKMITEELPENQYEISVIDIHKEPKLAFDDSIIAVPALIKKLPTPMRKVIGDLSDREKVILGLGLKPERLN